MESDINFDILLSSNNNSSSFNFNSSPFDEQNLNLFETLADSDNYIKLEPKSHSSSNEDQDFNSANIFSFSCMPITPSDDSEELLQIFPNKLPIRFVSSPPLEASISNSSSSLSLSLDINSSNFFKNENYSCLNITENHFSSDINCEQVSELINSSQNKDIPRQPTIQYQKYYNSFQFQQQPHQIIQQKIQNQPQTHYFQNEPQQYQHNFYNISTCSNNVSNINFTVNQNNYVNSNLSSKQDVSVGTDISIIKDLRYKKDFNWDGNCKSSDLAESTTRSNTSLYSNSSNYGSISFGRSSQSSLSIQPNSNPSNESFKLVEKIQPKKTRTKYTKEQIDVLEIAFWQSNYPEVDKVEQLCKTLGISKEKINIWFQNRRARNKRVNV